MSQLQVPIRSHGSQVFALELRKSVKLVERVTGSSVPQPGVARFENNPRNASS